MFTRMLLHVPRTYVCMLPDASCLHTCSHIHTYAVVNGNIKAVELD